MKNGFKTNKELGSEFESYFCIKMLTHGYWTYNCPQNQEGQPFDIIAVKDGYTNIFDCKVCSNDRFDLDRIEMNQESSMKLFSKCGNGDGYFIVTFSPQELNDFNKAFVIPFSRIMSAIENHWKSISRIVCEKDFFNVNEWLMNENNYRE